MVKPQRFAFTAVRDAGGEVALRPMLELALSYHKQVVSRPGLLDTGADVNVLPFETGLALGAVWEEQKSLARLSGNLGRYEVRGLVLNVQVEPFASVELVFAWTQAENVPVILGQVNFFQEFDVCFFRAQGFFEVQPKYSAKRREG
jgi:hypothetical protein